jgi:hypothetical protein
VLRNILRLSGSVRLSLLKLLSLGIQTGINYGDNIKVTTTYLTNADRNLYYRILKIAQAIGYYEFQQHNFCLKLPIFLAALQFPIKSAILILPQNLGSDVTPAFEHQVSKARPHVKSFFLRIILVAACGTFSWSSINLCL